ncbi:hypothetical protein HMPREF0476_1109 [Kingella kingae ATCC 23330]|uniref:Uncharacterized protein n=1 Tax=Kingella kingae ATCC 23330 TaxID=887327 RepID=F5S7C6_KINKI|nr:hypothetical protein HMPREF0476_1109 [Kingella kingae ATCC 23330]
MQFKVIASQNAQIILKYFQAFEKRITKKCAKDGVLQRSQAASSAQ